MSRLGLLSGSAIIACAISISATACAQDTREYNIPAGALGDALNAFATQSDQQIFFAGDIVVGLRSEGLRGRHTPTAALEKLLTGTGLEWSQTRQGVIYLRRGQGGSLADMAISVDDVIVTGSLLKSSGPMSSPVMTLDRDALEARGFATVAEAVTALPQNYAGSATPGVQLANSDTQGSNRVAATGVNLRGLGPASTLVLVNGRRMAGTGFRGDFSDISAMPSAAVERVDVLLDGASALYGADAVAGVVNVIMRRSFDGWETRLRASTAEGGAEDVVGSVVGGRSWSSGAGYLAYEYQTINALSSLDRSYTADGDLRPFGGTDRRLTFSAPGNLVAFNAATASYVSLFAIRPNATGSAQSAADFVVGAANLQTPSLGADLLPGIERHAAYGAVRQQIGDRLELSADVRYNKRDIEYAGPASIGLMTVTTVNPNFISPTGAASQMVGYSFVRDLGNPRQSLGSESFGVTAGATYDLGARWSVEGYVSLAGEEGSVRVPERVNTRFLNEALGMTSDDPATAYSAARDGYFNPYGAGSANSAAVLDFISSGFSETHDRSRASSANLLIQGPVFVLPGGDVQLAVGAQTRRETFQGRTTTFSSTPAPVSTSTPERARNIEAVFAEARIPIVGADNARPGLRSFELSLAGRFEDYSDFGTTTNPKVGVTWSPIDGLTLRSSWGTSFRAASLPQIHDNPAVSATFFARADGSRALALQLGGGNPDLKPETAETFTIGADFRRRNRLTLSANYFDTRFTDRIARPVAENLSGVLTDPNLVNFVTFVRPTDNASDLALVQSYLNRPEFTAGGLYPATNYAAIVDARWVNTGAVRVRGFDLSGRAPGAFGLASLAVDGSASYILDYETRSTPTAPVREVSGLIGFPVRFRSRLGATWAAGAFAASLHWNHVDAYEDRAGVQIDAWDTADAQASWNPETGALAGLRISLTVQNLLDKDPPFYDAASGFGYDPGQGNLLGRVVALQLIKRW